MSWEARVFEDAPSAVPDGEVERPATLDRRVNDTSSRQECFATLETGENPVALGTINMTEYQSVMTTTPYEIPFTVKDMLPLQRVATTPAVHPVEKNEEITPNVQRISPLGNIVAAPSEVEYPAMPGSHDVPLSQNDSTTISTEKKGPGMPVVINSLPSENPAASTPHEKKNPATLGWMDYDELSPGWAESWRQINIKLGLIKPEKKVETDTASGHAEASPQTPEVDREMRDSLTGRIFRRPPPYGRKTGMKTDKPKATRARVNPDHRKDGKEALSDYNSKECFEEVEGEPAILLTIPRLRMKGSVRDKPRICTPPRPPPLQPWEGAIPQEAMTQEEEARQKETQRQEEELERLEREHMEQKQLEEENERKRHADARRAKSTSESNPGEEGRKTATVEPAMTREEERMVRLKRLGFYKERRYHRLVDVQNKGKTTPDQGSTMSRAEELAELRRRNEEYNALWAIKSEEFWKRYPDFPNDWEKEKQDNILEEQKRQHQEREQAKINEEQRIADLKERIVNVHEQRLRVNAKTLTQTLMQERAEMRMRCLEAGSTPEQAREKADVYLERHMENAFLNVLGGGHMARFDN